VQELIEQYYPHIDDGVRFRDGTYPFYTWFLQEVSQTGGWVLNVGAGPTPEPGRRLRGRVQRLVGIDPDPRVMENADLDEARLFDGVNIPFEAGTFDAVFSDWTLEHVQRPLDLVREVRRVLKPGGAFWFRTPNIYHYAYILSSMTPTRLHTRVANFAQGIPRDARPHWPTYYRMNTAKAIRRIVKEAGFSACEIRHVEPQPAYLAFSALCFRGGVGYERLVNRFPKLAQLRAVLIVRAER